MMGLEASDIGAGEEDEGPDDTNAEEQGHAEESL